MPRADLRATFDLFGLRFTRSARLTIFTFFSDIHKGEQVESGITKILLESSDLNGLVFFGKATIRRPARLFGCRNTCEGRPGRYPPRSAAASGLAFLSRSQSFFGAKTASAASEIKPPIAIQRSEPRSP